MHARSSAISISGDAVSGEWIEPGTTKNIELNEIARQATVRVFTHADESGYGNLALTIIQAKVFDDPTSPYADAVASAVAAGGEMSFKAVRKLVWLCRAMSWSVASTFLSRL